MKSIAQLLVLSENPYYSFSEEERAALDAFLSKQQELKTQDKQNSTDSEKNIPAIVHNKNIVRPETGVMPLEDNDVVAAKGLGQLPGAPTTPK